MKRKKARIEEVIEKGSTASKLLNNPLIDNALEGIEKKCFNAFYNSKWFEWRQRNSTYYQMQAIKEFRKQLDEWIRNGLAEEAKLNHKEIKIV